MDKLNQSTELLEAIDQWADYFRAKRHPVSLTLFRAAVVIREQLAAEGGTVGESGMTLPSASGGDTLKP